MYPDCCNCLETGAKTSKGFTKKAHFMCLDQSCINKEKYLFFCQYCTDHHRHALDKISNELARLVEIKDVVVKLEFSISPLISTVNN